MIDPQPDSKILDQVVFRVMIYRDDLGDPSGAWWWGCET